MADGKITAAASVQQSYEEHNAQMYLALALKNTKFNNRLEVWQGLNATYDSNNKGHQRVRMQYLLQPKRAESILQTTEAVERWECDVREYKQRFGKTLDEGRQDRCHTCVGTTSSAEPLSLELAYPEELRTSQDDAV